MNREQRRNNKPQLTEREKVEKRLKAWVKTWTFEQKKLFEKMVENEVNKIEELTELVLNECFGVIISESFPGTTIEEVNEILLKANEYIEEVKDYIEKEGENYMKKVNDEELRGNIKIEAKAMLKENPKTSIPKIIKALKENYDLPDKDLHILCQESRKEREEEVMKELESSIVKETPKVDSVRNEVNKIKVTEPKEEITADKTGVKANGLKIKSIEIEGKYGTYIKDSEGVKTGDKVYKDITDLEREKEATKGDIKDQREEFNKKLAEINLYLRNLDEIEKEESEKFAEISAVFAM